MCTQSSQVLPGQCSEFVSTKCAKDRVLKRWGGGSEFCLKLHVMPVLMECLFPADFEVCKGYRSPLTGC